MEKKFLRFEAEIGGFTPINSSFARGFCRVGYAGKNRNGTYISKETFERAVKTLFYAPVVGEWKEKNDNFGGHGGILQIRDDELEYIDTTIPYGCVASEQDINWRWEKGKDGREYFTVDIFLWIHKFPQLQKIVEENSWHSMEVDIVDGHEAVMEGERVFVIEEMEFFALCILGKDLEDESMNVEPCFEASEIGVYSLDKNRFKAEFNNMVKDLKASLTKLNKLTDFIELSKKDELSPQENKKFKKLSKDADMKNLVNEMYLVVDGGFELSPSSKLHYPHHIISNGELILDEHGLKSAFEKVKNEELGKKPMEHIRRHYEELGLNQENFPQFDLSLEDYKEFFEKEDRGMAKFEKTKTPETMEKEVIKETSECGDKKRKHEADVVNSEEVAVEEVKAEEVIVEASEVATVEATETDTDVQNHELGDDEYKEEKEKTVETVEAEPVEVIEETEPVEVSEPVEAPESVEAMDLKYEELTQKFNDLNAEYEALKQDYEKIKDENKVYAIKEKQGAVDSIFAEFSNLLTEEDVSGIKEQALDMELDSLKNQLYAVYGAKVHKFNLQKSEKEEIVTMGINPVEFQKEEEASDESADLFEKAKKDLNKK